MQRLLVASLAALAVSACASARSRPDRVDDDLVTSRIANRFIADGRVSWIDIDIDTVDSVVTLRGITDDPEERRRAEVLAAGTPGVQRVVNRITISNPNTRRSR